jgi:DNA helicase-2/ATP-dependent DNA helicase PcrA
MSASRGPRRLCTISFAANRRVYGQWQSALPSRFIDELPKDHVEVLTPPGLYGGGYGMEAAEAAGIYRASELETRASETSVYNSPGWKRLQARKGERGLGSPREARNLVIDAEAVAAFGVGDRVFHQKFGYGGKSTWLAASSCPPTPRAMCRFRPKPLAKPFNSVIFA